MSGPEMDSATVADAPPKSEYVKPRLTVVPMQHAVAAPSVS